jgi:tetratricopeptide (TPR) repeat protein
MVPEKWMKAFLLLAVMTLLAGASPLFAAARDAGSLETLKQYVADLKKSPESIELREKVIKYAQGLKQKPPVPEEYERQMVRGSAFFKKAADTAGFQKAVEEYKAAVAAAPWIAEGYEHLAESQEKAAQYAEAIQNLNFALLADPNAKNARELRNRVYELEVLAEDANQKLKASPAVPLPAPPAPPVVAKAAPAPKKQAAPEKRTNPKVFVGSWYYKDTAPRGGDMITTHAFTINMNAAGELTAVAPRRSTGAVGSITVFEISGDNIHIQVTWKLATIPSYWKTEDYDVTLSGDETKLAGSYKIKSSGSREFAEDKTLFKQ